MSGTGRARNTIFFLKLLISAALCACVVAPTSVHLAQQHQRALLVSSERAIESDFTLLPRKVGSGTAQRLRQSSGTCFRFSASRSCRLRSSSWTSFCGKRCTYSWWRFGDSKLKGSGSVGAFLGLLGVRGV